MVLKVSLATSNFFRVPCLKFKLAVGKSSEEIILQSPVSNVGENFFSSSGTACNTRMTHVC